MFDASPPSDLLMPEPAPPPSHRLAPYSRALAIAPAVWVATGFLVVLAAPAAYAQTTAELGVVVSLLALTVITTVSPIRVMVLGNSVAVNGTTIMLVGMLSTGNPQAAFVLTVISTIVSDTLLRFLSAEYTSDRHAPFDSFIRAATSQAVTMAATILTVGLFIMSVRFTPAGANHAPLIALMLALPYGLVSAGLQAFIIAGAEGARTGDILWSAAGKVSMGFDVAYSLPAVLIVLGYYADPWLVPGLGLLVAVTVQALRNQTAGQVSQNQAWEVLQQTAASHTMATYRTAFARLETVAVKTFNVGYSRIQTSPPDRSQGESGALVSPGADGRTLWFVVGPPANGSGLRLSPEQRRHLQKLADIAHTVWEAALEFNAASGEHLDDTTGMSNYTGLLQTYQRVALEYAPDERFLLLLVHIRDLGSLDPALRSEVIEQFAQRLQENVRQTDECARVDDETFAVLFRHITDVKVEHTIRRRFNAHFGSVTVYVGGQPLEVFTQATLTGSQTQVPVAEFEGRLIDAIRRVDVHVSALKPRTRATVHLVQLEDLQDRTALSAVRPRH